MSNKTSNWRMYFLALIIIGVALLIIIRMYSLQVNAYSKYRLLADNQHKVLHELIAKRGEIFLQNSDTPYPVAVNREYQLAYLEPKKINDSEIDFVAERISNILGISQEKIYFKLRKRDDVFEILKHKLSDEEVRKIKEAKLPGVKLIPENFRYYPGGEMAAHLVGFVGSNGIKNKGQYGLEACWDEKLRGIDGSVSQERDAGGRWISIVERDLQLAKDGVDLELTIDYTVQYGVEKILKETIEKHNADEGSIIVQDPITGKILALAVYPTFNPNEYGEVDDMAVFINSAVSNAYEPGSVFKPITIAVGIDSGVISPATTYTDTGQVVEAGYTIKNSDEKAYGLQTMTQVLEKSLNTGVIYVEKLLGNARFNTYVKKFGFGSRSGIDLLGEAKGNIRNLEELSSDIQFFTASFGQGITTTPLQLANAYSVIANGGKLMKPQIVEKIIKGNKEEETIKSQIIRQVISNEAAKQTSEMLRSVVVNGHGKRADVPGYLVGGKTGTAQVAKSNSRGYDEGLSIGTFAGFAPTDNPLFTVVVKITNPKDVQWAESSAAPAFGKVMAFLLEHYNIEPTEEINN